MMKYLILLCFLWLSVLSLNASGRYNEFSMRLPQKMDLNLYKQGKDIINNIKGISKRDLNMEVDKNKNLALVEITKYLNNRKLVSYDLNRIVGKLNNDELTALIFYIKMRYRIFKIS